MATHKTAEVYTCCAFYIDSGNYLYAIVIYYGLNIKITGWNTAVHCVMIRIVCILNLKYGIAGDIGTWIPIVHMIYECALSCCW